MKYDDKSVWQSLMNRAYDRWRQPANKGWRHDDMLSHCSPAERAAVLLGNYNYQVENGGHAQWVYNGYATKGREVVDLLRKVAEYEKCDAAKQLADRLDVLMKHVDTDRKNHGFGNYWKDEDDEGYSEGCDVAQEMDDWYYQDVQPRLCPAIESFLAKMVKPKSSPTDREIYGDVPNLDDGMGADDLRNYAKYLRDQAPEHIHLEYRTFPTACLLALYAEAKAVAMEVRAAGDVSLALRLEGACDSIYKHLPEWARW